MIKHMRNSMKWWKDPEWRKKVVQKISEANKGKKKIRKEKSERPATLDFLIFKSNEYRDWKQSILDRDNHTCQMCGMQSEPYKPHKPYSPYPLIVHREESILSIVRAFMLESMDDALRCEALWNQGGAMTLCRKCWASIRYHE
jgi:hypothetical protein